MAGRRVVVIGLGNPDRGDDGLGPYVAERLAGRLSAGASLKMRTGDGLGLLDDWQGFEVAIIIDAAAPVGAPGRIHRIELETSGELPVVSQTSSHGFGFDEAFALASSMNMLPGRVIVYAVEGNSFDHGTGLTAAVAAFAEEVAVRVVEEVAGLLAGDGPGPIST